MGAGLNAAKGVDEEAWPPANTTPGASLKRAYLWLACLSLAFSYGVFWYGGGDRSRIDADAG